ncbi:MAG: hypothetical protein GWP10_06035 [Nitrospiraceae bacterium]|nr:hypothetical protein [Nitrospiraceae bacterium]
MMKPFLQLLATTAFATGNKRMPPSEGVQKEAGKAVQVTITIDNREMRFDGREMNVKT